MGDGFKLYTGTATLVSVYVRGPIVRESCQPLPTFNQKQKSFVTRVGSAETRAIYKWYQRVKRGVERHREIGRITGYDFSYFHQQSCLLTTVTGLKNDMK